MRSSLRWLVPVAVAATVAGGVAVSSAQAEGTPSLPQRTPEQVLASVADSSVRALSGRVATRADLGLPSLDVLGGGNSAPADDPAGLVTRFLSGANTLRVWVDGPTRQRAQLVDPFSELDVVRNGSQVWTYSSRDNTAQHATLPATSGKQAHGTAPSGTAADLTPEQLARQALAAVDPTTTVTLGDPVRVAGRDAYALTLTPRTDATLVGRIVIAVDAQKGVPLRVQVFPRGKQQAAIETGFTSVDFATPDASRFTFTPPPGATVQQLEAPGGTRSRPTSAKSTVTGSGWTSIVEVPVAAAQSAQSQAGGGSGRPDAAAALEQLTTPAGDGGHALTTSLVSVLFTKDGRVLAGAVPVQALVAAAR